MVCMCSGGQGTGRNWVLGIQTWEGTLGLHSQRSWDVETGCQDENIAKPKAVCASRSPEGDFQVRSALCLWDQVSVGMGAGEDGLQCWGAREIAF